MIWTIFNFEYPERAVIRDASKTTEKGIQDLTEQQ